MNVVEYLVAQGARKDVVIVGFAIGGITVLLAIVTRIFRRKDKPKPRQDADFCTDADYPVPDSLKDPRGKDGEA